MKNGKKKILTMVSVLAIIFSTLLPAYTAENYIVKSGDVLWKIAEKYGLTYQEIANENKLADPNFILAGQNLIIPSKVTTPAAPAAAPAPAPAAPKAAAYKAPEPGEKVLDTPAVLAEMDKVRILAGIDKSLIRTKMINARDVDEKGFLYGSAQNAFIGPNLNPGEEEHAEPTKLFDNLYYVGGTEVGCFIITTTEGYIMIDAGYKYMPEDYIIPDMKKLGLDPAKIKYIMITHGSGPNGVDHAGGVKYFNEHYGTKLVMSEQEWATTVKNVAKSGEKWVDPKDVVVGTDGQKLTLGDTTITMVHTPRVVNGGGLTYIAPVFDNGERHTWMTFGNTGVSDGLANQAVYRESIAKALKYVDAYKIDVLISNHPFVDLSIEKMEYLRNRKPGEPNPFVFGQARVARFFEVLDQCSKVRSAREEAGLDETGTKLLNPSAPKAGAPGPTAGKKPTITVSLDTPKILAELYKAQIIAGNDQALINNQILACRDVVDETGLPYVSPGATFDAADAVYAKPTKLFDNLYYVGGTRVGCFIFETTEGYIMIDAGYNYMPEDFIIRGMKELGLDPAQIKYILITHAGPDHLGGARYFQKQYGTRIIMADKEWNNMPKDGSLLYGFLPPDQDIIGTNEQTLTLGDTTITMIRTPRVVNGGGLTYIAPVFDNGERHMWMTYGNTGISDGNANKAVYRESIAKALTYVDKYKIDVCICSHPYVDLSIEKMEQLRNRKPGEPNPFVFGQERVIRFFDLLDQSCKVRMLRDDAGLDETGTKLKPIPTPSTR